MKKKVTWAICISSFVLCVYLMVCWIDIASHNADDYKYHSWNIIYQVWGKDEEVEAETVEPTTEITTEVTTEITTEQLTTQQTTTEATTVITTEITTEVTTEQTTTEEETEEETTEYLTERVIELTTTEAVVIATPNDSERIYNSEEVEMLAHLINGEAGAEWCCDTTRYYVGSVVLNRVNHSDFPDTIAGVIWQSGQYACTWDGNYDRTPSDRCYEIARDLLENGSWLPDNVVFQANFSQGSGVYDYIDGVYFCYR